MGERIATDADVTAWGLLAAEREHVTMRGADLVALLARLAAAEAERDRLRQACCAQNEAICQTLGKALGYPAFAADQANFPGATEADGVCVGDHVAETLASEAARRLAAAERVVEIVRAGLVDERPVGGTVLYRGNAPRQAADALADYDAARKGAP